MHIANRLPEFCIIAPTAYLDLVAGMSYSHLVLAHLIDSDPTYAHFYSNLKHTNPDHFIIMDNGAFELGGSYDPDKLIELATKVNADVIVLPDYPAVHSSKTIDAAERTIASIKAAGFKTMFVPQSKVGELDDWVHAYQYAATHPYIDMIGMSILGIPNAIPHVPASYSRVVMTHILIERGIFNSNKHHHYLGLNSGPNLEIPALLELGALDTCDSSGPVWSAILGHEYSTNTDSFLHTSKPLMHVNFNQPMTRDAATLNRIEYNVGLTLSLFD